MSKLILVTGGARSGKSRWALDFLREEPSKAFVATAQPTDPEFEQRIARHRRERGSAFDTYEEGTALGGLLASLFGRYAWILVDCVTMWLNNLLFTHADREQSVEGEIQRLFDALDQPREGGIVLVSNEVGMGIVPDNEVARTFRDMAGRVNQDLARRADEVIWLAAGIPVVIKGRGAAVS